MADPRLESPGRKPLVVLAAAALLLTAALGYVAAQKDDAGPTEPHRSPGPFRGNIIPAELRGKRAPAFGLTDARGGFLRTADLRGRPYIVTFLYTDCPDVCPLIGQELGQSLKLLGGRGDEVSVLAVSVDPKGDTAAAARAWLRRHRLPRNFHYLVGRERGLRRVWDAYFAAADPRARRQCPFDKHLADRRRRADRHEVLRRLSGGAGGHSARPAPAAASPRPGPASRRGNRAASDAAVRDA